MTELRPCPFCGAKMKVRGPGMMYTVSRCPTKGCYLREDAAGAGYFSRKALVTAWNRRSGCQEKEQEEGGEGVRDIDKRICWIAVLLAALILVMLLGGCGGEVAPNVYVVTQTCGIPCDHPFSGQVGKQLWVGPGTRIYVISREAEYLEAEGPNDNTRHLDD